MPWCIRCGTGLSQHELVGTDSYRELTHTSVYLALPIDGREHEHFLVWTTTPWTLTANVALAVHPELEYVKVKQGDDVYILSPEHDRLPEGRRTSRSARLPRRELVGCATTGRSTSCPAPAASSIGSSPGRTSARKKAPASSTSPRAAAPRTSSCRKVEHLDGHRPDQRERRLYSTASASSAGRTSARPMPCHLRQPARRRACSTRLQDYPHRYPSCWRCGEELVFRLADEWFISAHEIREPMKARLGDRSTGCPSAGKRMEDWLNNMGDWNISRKRYWGLPLPFYPCETCGELR